MKLLNAALATLTLTLSGMAFAQCDLEDTACFPAKSDEGEAKKVLLAGDMNDSACDSLQKEMSNAEKTSLA